MTGKKPQIEVTPLMLELGRDALREAKIGDPIDEIVESVFWAMIGAADQFKPFFAWPDNGKDVRTAAARS